jgi:fatty acid desaturase
MMLLVALLALNALLHAAVVYRYGTSDKANMPFLIFTFVNTALALVVFMAVPYAVWATLVLSVFGLIGLTVTFNKPQREDKTLDKVIWAADAAVALCAIWLLFLA